MTNIAPRQDCVDILLATFNGQRFIQRQVESVLEQMDSGCRLLIRDDGSTDGTVSLVQSLFARHPGRIVLLEDASPGLGSCRSFGRLLEYADADYVVLCDQDDVSVAGPTCPADRTHQDHRAPAWHAHAGPGTYQSRSCRRGPPHGCLVVLVVQQSAAPGADRMNRLLVQNVVTGCATTINRALAELASPIPEASAPMHDWWRRWSPPLSAKSRPFRRPRSATGNMGATAWARRTTTGDM